MEAVTRLKSRLQSLLDQTDHLDDDMSVLADHSSQIDETFARLEEELNAVSKTAMTTAAMQTIEALRSTMKTAVDAAVYSMNQRMTAIEAGELPLNLSSSTSHPTNQPTQNQSMEHGLQQTAQTPAPQQSPSNEGNAQSNKDVLIETLLIRIDQLNQKLNLLSVNTANNDDPIVGSEQQTEKTGKNRSQSIGIFIL